MTDNDWTCSDSSSSPDENGSVECDKETNTETSTESPNESYIEVDFGTEKPLDNYVQDLSNLFNGFPCNIHLVPLLDSTTKVLLRFHPNIESDEEPIRRLESLSQGMATVARVQYRLGFELFERDRKKIISIFDLPDLTMNGYAATTVEKSLKSLSLADSETVQANEAQKKEAKDDPRILKRGIIITILKDELKGNIDSEFIRQLCIRCDRATMKASRVIFDTVTQDHFFLLLSKASEVMENLPLIRRMASDTVTVRRITEANLVVQQRFMNLCKDSSTLSSFPFDSTEEENDSSPERSSDKKSTSSSDMPREIRDRPRTSGHVARRLVEGSLGIRSTVTREQIKAENKLVANYAAERKATRKKKEEMNNELNAAFD